MENQHFIYWGFGLCATGFFFLLGWIIPISGQTAKMTEMKQDIGEIKIALLGTMEKKGLITKIHDQEVRVDAIEKVCNERHHK